MRPIFNTHFKRETGFRRAAVRRPEDSGSSVPAQGTLACRRHFFRTASGSTFAGLLVVLIWLGPASEALGFMDHGGRISREFAKAELRWEQGGEILSEDLVLFTWAGGGSKSEHRTLFAFCADGDCDTRAPRYASWDDVSTFVPSGNECKDGDAKDPQVTFPVPSPHCQFDQGCFWSWELPDSRGDISHSPPVAHQVGDQTLPFDDAETADRVFVATSNDGGGGTVWSFDLDGACNWGTKFTNKQAKRRIGISKAHGAPLTMSGTG